MKLVKPQPLSDSFLNKCLTFRELEIEEFDKKSHIQ